MILTPQQEDIIKKYLSEVNNYLSSVEDIEKRKQLLIELKNKILSTIQNNGKSFISDSQLCRILDEELGEPKLQAEILANPRDTTKILTLNYEKRVWLGVCAGLAERLKVPKFLIRFIFFVLGLVGGLGIVIYLVIYFYLYFTSGVYRGKKVRWGFLIYQIILTLLLAILIYGVSFMLIRGLEYIHLHWVSQSQTRLPNLDSVYKFTWASFLLLSWTGILCSIMGGLPLRNDWDETFRNVRDAQMALLGVVETAGIVMIMYYFILDAIKTIQNLVV